MQAMFAYMMLSSTPSEDAARDFANMDGRRDSTQTLFKPAEPAPETLV
jgi:hypothetical protein